MQPKTMAKRQEGKDQRGACISQEKAYSGLRESQKQRPRGGFLYHAFKLKSNLDENGEAEMKCVSGLSCSAVCPLTIALQSTFPWLEKSR